MTGVDKYFNKVKKKVYEKKKWKRRVKDKTTNLVKMY